MTKKELEARIAALEEGIQWRDDLLARYEREIRQGVAAEKVERRTAHMHRRDKVKATTGARKATTGARKAGAARLKGPENARAAIDKDFEALDPAIVQAYYAGGKRAEIIDALLRDNRTRKTLGNYLTRYRKR
jgi:hypothetical protein